MATAIELCNEGTKLKDAGDLEAAAAKLDEAVAADGEYALAHSTAAVVKQRLGQHEAAIEHAKRVTELEPNDAFSFTALSVTYQRAYAGTNEMKYIQLAEDAMAKSRDVEMGA